MLFGTKLFILGFLPLAFCTGWLGRRAALCWVLCCSLVFYAWWKPVFATLLIASILVNFWLGKRIIGRQRRRAWLATGLAFNLALLGFFKYASFFAAMLGLSAAFGGILLPL